MKKQEKLNYLSYLSKLLRALDNQVKRNLQVDYKARESKGIENILSTKSEDISVRIYKEFLEGEVDIYSLLILLTSLVKVLNMASQEFSQSDLGKYRYKILKEAINKVDRDLQEMIKGTLSIKNNIIN